MESNRLIETVIKARQGDREALQDLYLDMHRSVYFLALRFVKNPEDAEDITQEVYITVQQKIPELREPVAFYVWVNQITVNKCKRFLGKYKGISLLDDGDEFIDNIIDDDPTNLPDKALDDEATRKIILEVIDNLPDAQRACVMLFYYAEFTISQISDMLETNENTVKTRLAAARAKIRAALEDKAEKEGIKLWGIPLALTPILRQDFDNFVIPPDVDARLLDFISKLTAENAGAGENPGVEHAGSSATTATQSIISKSAVKVVGKVIANMLTRKALTILLSVIGAAAVITAGVIFLPPLFNSSEPVNTPGVSGTETPGNTPDPGISNPTSDPSTTPGDYEGTYEGLYDANGKRSGWGEWVYYNYRYVGYWENDMPNGEGTLYIAGGPGSENWYMAQKIISGTWVDGYANGPTNLIYNVVDNGQDMMYTGSFSVVNGAPIRDEITSTADGTHNMIVNANELFAGVPPWANVKTDSTIAAPTPDPGTSIPSDEPPSPDPTDTSGGTYEGEYNASGQRHGYGIWTYYNYRYEGSWTNGMPNGEGTLYRVSMTRWTDNIDYELRTSIGGHWVNGFANGTIEMNNHADIPGQQYDYTYHFEVENGRYTTGGYIYDDYGSHPYSVSEDIIVAGVPPWADVWVVKDAP